MASAAFDNRNGNLSLDIDIRLEIKGLLARNKSMGHGLQGRVYSDNNLDFSQ